MPLPSPLGPPGNEDFNHMEHSVNLPATKFDALVKNVF